MRSIAYGAILLLAAACAAGGGDPAEESAAETADVVAADEPAAAQAPACQPMTNAMPVEGRTSPYDSALIRLDGALGKICYGRPSLRGRTMLGSERVPYDTIWRTGANEPTTIHLPVAAEIGGIAVEPGSYSLYTVPREGDWTLIVNRSTSQWGHESRYSQAVRAQEVGRAPVPSEPMDERVETFSIRPEPSAGATDALVLEWQNTRVRVPIRAQAG